MNKNDYVLSNGLRSNVYYDEIEDFEKMHSEPEILKIVVIGDMGLGKSTLCNKFCGLRFMYNDEDSETDFGELIRVDDRKDISPHFQVSNTHISKTQKTGFVLSHYLGNPELGKVMIIDSPGLFDPKELEYKKNSKVKESSSGHMVKNPFFFSDLMSKLVAMKSISALIMMLSPSSGGRVPLNVLNTIRALNYMFEKAECSIMMNLIFAYSKCDEDNPRSYSGLLRKRSKEYSSLADFISEFGVTVPKDVNSREVYFLSNIDPSPERIGQKEEFLKMWEFINTRIPILTEAVENPENFIQNGTNPFFFEAYSCIRFLIIIKTNYLYCQKKFF